tara:strand:- start:2331 stop:2522 length:192 start_codon:yes stop_codon:yes gene_type:complete
MNKSDKAELHTAHNVQKEYITKLREVLVAGYGASDPTIEVALELIELIEINTEVSYLVIGVES